MYNPLVLLMQMCIILHLIPIPLNGGSWQMSWWVTKESVEDVSRVKGHGIDGTDLIYMYFII